MTGYSTSISNNAVRFNIWNSESVDNSGSDQPRSTLTFQGVTVSTDALDASEYTVVLEKNYVASVTTVASISGSTVTVLLEVDTSGNIVGTTSEVATALNATALTASGGDATVATTGSYDLVPEGMNCKTLSVGVCELIFDTATSVNIAFYGVANGSSNWTVMYASELLGITENKLINFDCSLLSYIYPYISSSDGDLEVRYSCS